MDRIEANGASLRYDVSGSGNETVVLIHEVGGCSVSVTPPDRGGAARRPAPGPPTPRPPPQDGLSSP